jgi:hypothetical protein
MLDADADGVVSFSEFTQFNLLAMGTSEGAATAELGDLAELDLDKDGFLSSIELYFFTQLAVMMADRDSGDGHLSWPS